MVHGGVCITHMPDVTAPDTKGITVFVDGGIPGELAEIELSYRKKKVWFARVVEAVEPSPNRVEPPCPYVGTCGGCQLQHIHYPAQLALKRDIVLDAMRREAVTLPDTVGLYGMDNPWRYRWRGEFHVIPGVAAHGETSAIGPGLGFNRVRSWHPVAVDDCLIHHETITRSIPVLRNALARGATPDLSVLHVTAGDDGRELLLRPKPKTALDPATIDAVSGDLPDGITLSTGATTLHWRGHAFRAAPESFIQVNQQQMDVLYTCVIDALGDVTGKCIVDAYAGIGVMSVAFAETAAEVICIEENRTSARMGVLNAELNGVQERLHYIAEPVEEALNGVVAGATGGPVDAVILDPPRAGCDTRVTAWLALAGPEQVVYVSCDPATLARDLRVMVTSGPYVVERFDIVDMFPQTHHVECVASLRRASSASPISNEAHA